MEVFFVCILPAIISFLWYIYCMTCMERTDAKPFPRWCIVIVPISFIPILGWIIVFIFIFAVVFSDGDFKTKDNKFNRFWL